jgi:hypothetical protein
MAFATMLLEKIAMGAQMRDTEHDFERLDEALRLTPSLSSEAFQQVIEHCARLFFASASAEGD